MKYHTTHKLSKRIFGLILLLLVGYTNTYSQKTHTSVMIIKAEVVRTPIVKIDDIQTNVISDKIIADIIFGIKNQCGDNTIWINGVFNVKASVKARCECENSTSTIKVEYN